MATTTPNNIPSPDSGSNYDPTVHMTALADGVQEALTERANYGIGTTAQMNAAVNRFPDGAMWYNITNSTEYRRVGGAWVEQGVEDTGWVPLPLKTGYEPYDSSYPCDYRRIGSIVHLRGLVSPTGGEPFATGSAHTVSEIPAAVAPNDNVFGAGGTTSNRSPVTIVISPASGIQVRCPNEGTLPYAGLGGISWLIG